MKNLTPVIPVTPVASAHDHLELDLEFVNYERPEQGVRTRNTLRVRYRILAGSAPVTAAALDDLGRAAHAVLEDLGPDAIGLTATENAHIKHCIDSLHRLHRAA